MMPGRPRTDLEGRVIEGRPPKPVGWLGRTIILNYTNGPSPQSPWVIEKGEVEARAGLFFLEEMSDWGIVVRKVMEEGGLAPSVLISWGAVQVIRPYPDEEYEALQDTPEGLVNLSFAVGPFDSRVSAQQSLVTLTFNARLVSVTYTPSEFFVVNYGEEAVREIALRANETRGADLRLAWFEDRLEQGMIEPGYELPLSTAQDQDIILEQGDELYWSARSLSSRDHQGDPGGTVNIVLQVVEGLIG